MPFGLKGCDFPGRAIVSSLVLVMHQTMLKSENQREKMYHEGIIGVTRALPLCYCMLSNFNA